MPEVIHSIHFPVSARSFVVPIVDRLNQIGISTELWVENHPKHADTIAQLSVPKQFVKSDLCLHPIRFLQQLSDYRRRLRSTQPRILHAHQTRAALIPLLAAYLEKVPVRIYHNHGLPYLGYRGILRWLLHLLEMINVRLATQVVLVSHSNLEAARSTHLLTNAQGFVPGYGSAIGLDLDEFDPHYFSEAVRQQARKKWGISSDAFVLAYVGRPVKRKGFHLLLKAWERTDLGNQNHILLTAGCTATECQTALNRPIPGVIGLGYLTDLREFYAACDAIVLPSQHEGFGYAFLEGAAAAKPLIGTDIPGVRCAIQHRKTGLLVSVNDEIALAQAIVELAFDLELRSRLGQNARKRVEQEFSRKIVLEDLLRLYQRELGYFSASSQAIATYLESVKVEEVKLEEAVPSYE